MLARWLKVVLAAILLLLGLLTSRFAPEHAVTLKAAAVLSGLLLVCLIVTLLTYAIMLVGRLRHSEPLPSALALLGGIVAEWASFTALFLLIQPFERWWMGNDAQCGDSGDQPLVLMVHGYCCNRGLWWWHRRLLLARGVRVATVNLEPAFAGIDDFVVLLRRRIDALAPDTGPIVLVCHSMGGLVARAYIGRHGAGRICKVITIGTPHYGTWLARLGLGRCAREMQPASAFLTQLSEGSPLPVPLISICSRDDNFLIPAASAELKGARHQRVAGLGHLSMAFSREIADLVADEVARR